MSAELIGILGVGAALAGLMMTGWLAMDRRMNALEVRLSRVEGRLGRVEGLLEGLGLSGRSEALAAGD